MADPNCTYPRCLTGGCHELCRSVHPATAWPRIQDAIQCLEGQLFHPSASHVNPEYRDGWNRATNAALTLLRKVAVTHGTPPTPAALRWSEMPKPLQNALLAYHARPCDEEAGAVVRAVLNAYGPQEAQHG